MLMSVRKPIIILEDDLEDQELFTEAFKELQTEHPLLFFSRGEALLQYLLDTTEQPFLIISDVNMPEMSGLEFQKRVQENEVLRKKSVPFIFFTTSDDMYAVNQAYMQTVQGFFKKPDNFSEFKEILRHITEYWRHCIHPNTKKR